VLPAKAYWVPPINLDSPDSVVLTNHQPCVRTVSIDSLWDTWWTKTYDCPDESIHLVGKAHRRGPLWTINSVVVGKVVVGNSGVFMVGKQYGVSVAYFAQPNP
jgi:hypothetical protein